MVVQEATAGGAAERRWSVDVVREAVADVLVGAGTTSDNAAAVARALVLAEIDGQSGHGLSRVESYAAQVRAGKVVGDAAVSTSLASPAALRIDAAHGFAYPALEALTTQLPAIATAQGIALAGVVRSHHAGALGQVTERLADAGLISLMFANTPSAMTAWGGRKAVFGTNPIAFGAPRLGKCPSVVIDLALSEVARGRIVVAAQKGEKIPEGWATDDAGRPTTDPNAALKGALMPAGGAKGAALALMVEVMAAALTGSKLAGEATPFLNAEGGPPDVGQTVIAIDPGALGDGAAALTIVERLAADIEADAGARLPGGLRPARREKAARLGLAVRPAIAEVLALS